MNQTELNRFSRSQAGNNQYPMRFLSSVCVSRVSFQRSHAHGLAQERHVVLRLPQPAWQLSVIYIGRRVEVGEVVAASEHHVLFRERMVNAGVDAVVVWRDGARPEVVARIP
jgi:hypothetical protein